MNKKQGKPLKMRLFFFLVTHIDGKPEPLKGDMSGFWSRRIDDVNRLVYRIHGDVMEIISCKGHYED